MARIPAGHGTRARRVATFATAACSVALWAPRGVAQEPRRALVEVVRELTSPLVEEESRFGYALRASRSAETAGEPIAELILDVTGEESFAVHLRSSWINASLARTPSRTVLVLPDSGVAWVGEGELAADGDSLAPAGFTSRLLGGRGSFGGVARALALQAVRSVEAEDGGRWRLDADTALSLSEKSGALIATSSKRKGFGERIHRLELSPREPVEGLVSTEGLRVKPIGRGELEKMVFRAVRRAASIQWPGPLGITRPRPRSVPHGELREVEGQLLVMLEGTPEQIGTAHGQLLGGLVHHTIDSTLYLVGLIETVRTGKWFPSVLEDAWRRLSPHIPDRHKRELAAMADAIPGLSRREIELGNVFPEYFHCSGFALFGRATVDGVLYHGRVLDYMTLIGLQQAAATLVVRPAGLHPFMSASYAGFQGVVSGMNDQQISLGEMGGAGRFQWDGVPMATLMRRGLEECSTLDEVLNLWRENPRTCEYYYVFADGKGPRAVAVKAVPEAVSFIGPGEAHELLGPGIEDVVVISAGSRLKLLRERVQAQHGKIDAEAALRLMDRPVAMSSNLHNVLFRATAGGRVDCARPRHAAGCRTAVRALRPARLAGRRRGPGARGARLARPRAG